MIVADTGAIIALVDADDLHHQPLRRLFEENPDRWIVPWAVLPEVDYLLGTRVGVLARRAFMQDVACEAFTIEWGDARDVQRAAKLENQYSDLGLGLVDGVVIGIAERLSAAAIATVDLRHFGAVAIEGRPKIFPRDL